MRIGHRAKPRVNESISDSFEGMTDEAADVFILSGRGKRSVGLNVLLAVAMVSEAVCHQ